MADQVTIAFRGTIEYRDRLQDEARARRIKMQELIERAIEVYLRQGSAAAEIAAERAADRVAREALAPAGTKLIVVPNEMAEIFQRLLEFYATHCQPTKQLNRE